MSRCCNGALRAEIAVLEAEVAALEAEVDSLRGETIWELDWTAEPDLALANGGNTIAGASWTGANSAAATVYSVKNGIGLQITATGGVSRTWTTSAVTAPSLRIDVDDLATIDWSRDVWVWTRMSTYTLPTLENYVAAGLYAAASGSLSGTMISSGWKHAGGPFTQATYQRNTTLYDSAVRTAAPPSGQIGDVTVLRYTADGQAISYIGTWANGWPSRSSLIVFAKDGQPESSAVVEEALLASRDPQNTQLLFSVMTRTAAAGDPAMVVSHSRIQQSG